MDYEKYNFIRNVILLYYVQKFQQLTRNQYKGYLKALQTCIAGLEYSYNSSGSNGLASLFHVLEIAHSHYWTKETELTSPASASGSSVKFILSLKNSKIINEVHFEALF